MNTIYLHHCKTIQSVSRCVTASRSRGASFTRCGRDGIQLRSVQLKKKYAVRHQKKQKYMLQCLTRLASLCGKRCYKLDLLSLALYSRSILVSQMYFLKVYCASSFRHMCSTYIHRAHARVLYVCMCTSQTRPLTLYIFEVRTFAVPATRIKLTSNSYSVEIQRRFMWKPWKPL